MWKEIKTGFRLIKYSHNFKQSIGFGAFFAVFGAVFMYLNNFVLGSIYFFISAVMLIQLNNTQLFGQMTLSSPRRKGLEIIYPNALSGVTATLWYIIVVVIASVCISVSPEKCAAYNAEVISASIAAMICMIYYGACYKYYIASTIIFVVTFMVVYPALFTNFKLFVMETIGVNSVAAFAIGLGFALFGCTCSNLLRRLLYRKSMSSWAMGANLRKVMQ